jgi:hypothetical protein
MSREEIVAARRERRSREKSAARPSGGPARYRKKSRRDAIGTPLEEPFYEDESEALDPLDAQNAGLHEAQLELGHEEIIMNLDDDPEVMAEPKNETPTPHGGG